MKKSGVIVVLAVLVLAVGVIPAVAKKMEIIESYDANALVETVGAGSMATINIYRWSSDAERDELLGVIKSAKSGDRDVAKALRGQEKAGYAFMAGKQGYPLRYAREFKKADGKRQLILATDRPVSFQEGYTDSMAGDFDVTIIILNVDENGKGDGILSVGTEVKWDDKTNKIEPTNMSSQPVKLTNVRPGKK
jgi:competence protein ComGC